MQRRLMELDAQLDEIREWEWTGAVICEVPDDVWERYQRATEEYFDALDALQAIYLPAEQAQRALNRVANGRTLAGDEA